METNAQSSNIVTEIRQALASHKELSRVANYLNLGEKEILQNLVTSQTGLQLDHFLFYLNVKEEIVTGSGHTFFAPTNWAFVLMVPQDISDPFFVDAKLRQNVILHHFVRQSLTTDDLLKKSELLMADEKPSTLTRSGANGTLSTDKLII